MTTVGHPPKSLYDRLGGAPAVEAAVDIFYTRVLNDDRVGHFFSNKDVRALRGKQKAFLTMVFGGPKVYSGKSLREAHADMKGVDDSHFDVVAGHLVATLQQLGVHPDLIKEVVAIAESTRAHVLNR